MSWAKLDDHANEHRKQVAAGADACWLWACGLMYANRQPARDGFVPDGTVPMLYPFKNARKLAARLVNVGLWTKADGGYQIHEFTLWNKNREQLDAERESTRNRVAKHRAKPPGNGGSNGDGNGVTPTDVTPPSNGVGTGSLSPTTTTPLPPQTPPGGGDGQIGCPPDLSLTSAQRGVHETAMVPGWAIDEITNRFRASWADGSSPRTLEQWRRSLSTAVSKTWNDPAQRPKKPGSEPKPPAEEAPLWR